MTQTRQAPWADLAVGALVMFMGLADLITDKHFFLGFGLELTVTTGFAAAAALYRRQPPLALALLWASGILLMAGSMDIGYAQILAVAVVSFGCGRYGSPAALVASGLSIPVAAVISTLYLRYTDGELPFVRYLAVAGTGPATAVAMVLLGVVALASPWLLGLVLRERQRATSARSQQHEAELQAARIQEIATLRAQQAQLARDVHDVVGHSLAVIIAQADSAQYLPDQQLDRIRAVLANIAASARQSLGDVRQVLTTTAPAPARGLDSLIEPIRAGGTDIRVEDTGVARPVPPELEAVAYRVLQEMLTNALKHGQPGEPITVVRTWSDDVLRLQVRNTVGTPAHPGQPGLGIAGMHRRLLAVGGSLEVEPAGTTFTVTATVPVRPQAPHERA